MEKLEATKASLSRKIQEATDAQKENADLSKELTTLQNKNTSLQRENTSLKTKVDALIRELDAYEAELSARPPLVPIHSDEGYASEGLVEYTYDPTDQTESSPSDPHQELSILKETINVIRSNLEEFEQEGRRDIQSLLKNLYTLLDRVELSK
ncbi:MAG: hypothetical protein LVR00_04220 [Rhabdochlamydiaceae bacterium]|jgi:regulator of replication initiation timing